MGGTTTVSASPIRNTETYAGITFHLYQLVHHDPNGPELNQTWVVVSLRNGLTLADPDFNRRITYTEREIRQQEFDPECSVDGTPLFAY
jgi:hypothetical protein